MLHTIVFIVIHYFVKVKKKLNSTWQTDNKWRYEMKKSINKTSISIAKGSLIAYFKEFYSK